MTIEEIYDIFIKNGFTYFNDDKRNDVYIYGEIEVTIIDSIIIRLNVGSLKDNLRTSLKYFIDEVSSIEISNYKHFDNLKKLTIEVEAGINEIYFR